MSQLGNIEKSYGKQFNIAIANTYSYNVLKGNNLPANTFIIASNVDEDLNDTGSYSLIVTDANGTPIRLTYSLSEGNGLYYSSKDDAISMHIDNKTLKTSQNKIYFDLASVLSDDLILNGNSLNINMSSIKSSTRNNYGVAKIDNRTLKMDGDSLYVSTDNLNYSNNSTEQYGIGLGDNKTIFTNNGVISLNINSLNKSNSERYGIVSSDNNTIKINDGIISVNTEALAKANASQYGISKPDNRTIVFDKNRNITVNEQNLSLATNTEYGLAKIDNASLNVENGKISMKDYDNINSYIDKYSKTITNYKNKINEYNNFLSSGNILFKDKSIQQFVINETSVAEFTHPKENEEIINMPLQTVSAVFDIVTTCDFIMTIQFEEDTNEFPNVDILEVNYNDEKTYTKTQALDVKTVYKSTEGQKKKLIIKFIGKNYRNSVRTEYVITSINVTIANKDDNTKSKTEKFSIVRYNSLYYNIKEEKEEKEKAKVYVIDQDSAYWREV